MHQSRAVFLDRDGVINELLFHLNPGIIESPFTTRQFKLKPGVGKAIRQINQLGLKAIVVSNQPGIALRHFSRRTLTLITQKMLRLLKRESAVLDGIYYCLHHPQRGTAPLKQVCSCRKPKAGLLRKAAKDFKINLKRSYLVGDSIMDIWAGRRAGCTTFLTAHLKCDLCRLMAERGVKPRYVVKDLAVAVRTIRRLERTK